MKRFFTLFVAVIMSAFLLAGCAASEQDTEAIAELQATVDDLQNQVEEYSALKTELDSANNSITELQSEIDDLKTEKEEISSKLEMLYKIEPLDETMYAMSDGDIYDDLYGEVFGNEPAGTISAEQEIKITGKSAVTGWYEIETDGKKQYVSGSLLSTTKPQQTTKPSGNTGNGNTGNNGQSSGGNNQPSGNTEAPGAGEVTAGGEAAGGGTYQDSSDMDWSGGGREWH